MDFPIRPERDPAFEIASIRRACAGADASWIKLPAPIRMRGSLARNPAFAETTPPFGVSAAAGRPIASSVATGISPGPARGVPKAAMPGQDAAAGCRAALRPCGALAPSRGPSRSKTPGCRRRANGSTSRCTSQDHGAQQFGVTIRGIDLFGRHRIEVRQKPRFLERKRRCPRGLSRYHLLPIDSSIACWIASDVSHRGTPGHAAKSNAPSASAITAKRSEWPPFLRNHGRFIDFVYEWIFLHPFPRPSPCLIPMIGLP